MTQQLIPLWTLIRKELTRISRIWAQSLLPIIMTSTLYFLIFGKVIGHRIGLIHGVPYLLYIAPGLIALNTITSAYAAATGAFYSVKFNRSIEELLASPMYNSTILCSYISIGILRGVISAVLVGAIAYFFNGFHVHATLSLIFCVLLTSGIFSSVGVINAIYATSFADISIVPNFILTPLTYLSGVFYSIAALPPIWQQLSKLDPIVYIINAFRFSVIGIPDPHLYRAFAILIVLLIALFTLALYLMQSHRSLRQ